MKNLRWLYLVFLLLFMAFRADDDKIAWSTSKLVWDDFKGNPALFADEKAVTAYEIVYAADVEDNMIKVQVVCLFDKNKSWVKSDGKTDYILNHEQRHFDLAEIYTRKLRKELLGITGLKPRQLQARLTSIYQKYFNKCTAEQRRYDYETNHSINVENQEKWNVYIDQQLELYTGYNDTIITFPMEL